MGTTEEVAWGTVQEYNRLNGRRFSLASTQRIAIMRIMRKIWALVVVAGLLAGCSVPYPPCELSALIYPSGIRLQGDTLSLGIIDASSRFTFDLPEPLRQSGATLVMLDDVRWGYVEPEPPQEGIHFYEWDDEIAALDTRVQTYQQVGFELGIVLRAWNTWARAASPQGGLAAAAASTPPRVEYRADYAAWVEAVVERYDGDGVDDYPGLVDTDGDGSVDPIRYYQIETDAVSGIWWQGATPEQTVSDYLFLLDAAAEAARRASPQATILLASIPGLDLLDQFPTPEGLEDIVTNIDPAACGAIAAYAELLQKENAYDIATVSSAADYTGLATLSDWIATLAGRPLEVWITGSTSAPALTADPQSLSVNPLFPGNGESLWANLQQGDDTTERWYQAEQARLSVKKWVYAAWSGFDALIVGLEQDRLLLENPTLGKRDLAFQGMLDQADGLVAPGQRPVIPALALAQAQLSGYTAIRQLAGLGDGVEAFELLLESSPVYVLWYDDGIAQGPHDAPVSTTVHQPVRASKFTALTVPTASDQQGPEIDILYADDGILELTLTETPVILRGEWAAQYWPSIQQ
ncbi:MAG: hypothetical protein GY759_14270 [Chloroflexi bacterium]|nr:hypothetical protein [Chloroflexota bacterium]